MSVITTQTQKINITFFLPSLVAGGAERVMSYVAQNLDKSKFETTVVIVGFENESRFSIEDTDVIFLNKSRVLYSISALFGYFRKAKVDIAISSIRHMNVVIGALSFLFPRTKFVGREVNVMSVLKDYPETNNRQYPRLLIKWGYSLLDKIICQSQDMYNDLLSEYPQMKDKLVIINNPITDKFKPKKEKPTISNGLQLITVASLEPRKGHLRILEGLGKLDIPFTYTIIGDGSQKDAIVGSIRRLGLQNYVIHVPFSEKINEFLIKSHVFVQGSYVEGFPNALLESCAVGTPVVAFKAPGGINEIVVDKVNGFVVADETEFLRAIKTIADSANFQPAAVSASVFEKYGSSIILNKYEELFSRLINT